MALARPGGRAGGNDRDLALSEQGLAEIDADPAPPADPVPHAPLFGPRIPLEGRIARALVLRPLLSRCTDIASAEPRARRALQAALWSVEALNQQLADATFGGMAPPVFRRSFLYSLDLDGRFHTTGAGSFSTLSREARRHLTIGGEPVVEVDIRASGPTILLALLDPSQLPPPEVDLYALPGLPRAAVKAAMLSALVHGRMPGQWGIKVPAAIRRMPMPVVREAVLAAYPAFRKPVQVLPPWLLGQLSWPERRVALGPYINARESHVLWKALRSLLDANVVALPLHDGLVVAGGAAGRAQDALATAFEAQLGVQPTITISETAQFAC